MLPSSETHEHLAHPAYEIGVQSPLAMRSQAHTPDAGYDVDSRLIRQLLTRREEAMDEAVSTTQVEQPVTTVPEVVEDVLVDEVSIDGMCGVY